MKYKKWKLASPDQAAVSALAEAGLPVLAALVLCARGLSEPGAAQAFLAGGGVPLHDPFLMRDMDRAAGRAKKPYKTDARVLFTTLMGNGLPSTGTMMWTVLPPPAC